MHPPVDSGLWLYDTSSACNGENHRRKPAVVLPLAQQERFELSGRF